MGEREQPLSRLIERYHKTDQALGKVGTIVVSLDERIVSLSDDETYLDRVLRTGQVKKALLENAQPFLLTRKDQLHQAIVGRLETLELKQAQIGQLVDGGYLPEEAVLKSQSILSKLKNAFIPEVIVQPTEQPKTGLSLVAERVRGFFRAGVQTPATIGSTDAQTAAVSEPSAPPEEPAQAPEFSESLPTVTLNLKTKEVASGEKNGILMGKGFWEALLCVIDGPEEGVSAKEIDEAAKKGGSDAVWGGSYYISRLRKIIEEDHQNPKIITRSGTRPNTRYHFHARVVLLNNEKDVLRTIQEGIPAVDASQANRDGASPTVAVSKTVVLERTGVSEREYGLTADEIFALSSILRFLATHGSLEDVGISQTSQQILSNLGILIDDNNMRALVREMNSIEEHVELDPRQLSTIFRNIREKFRGLVESPEEFTAQNKNNAYIAVKYFRHFKEYQALTDCLFVIFDTFAKARFIPDTLHYKTWSISALSMSS